MVYTLVAILALVVIGAIGYLAARAGAESWLSLRKWLGYWKD